ncbi:hypothetical protein ONZ51_g12556 [Trametes cubensis]|uniref:DUF6570 domain-containing protein n=1 Tax=Trametes cubensis TaxID=1111947 RepID=A0AAD7X4I5_9APHY|nr:hypothetical protein ONZ51_g12556 [Trametes cubensis]
MARSSSLFDVVLLAQFELVYGDALPLCGSAFVAVRMPLLHLLCLPLTEKQQISKQHGISGRATRSSSGIADVFDGHVYDCFPASPIRRSPTLQVYDVLPPSRADLNACLAIISTGLVKPTDDDYKRTPFIIRHDVVMSALSWLKLNHSLYRSVKISPQNLAHETENSVPVYETSDPTSTPADAPCPFMIHTLNASELGEMTFRPGPRSTQHPRAARVYCAGRLDRRMDSPPSTDRSLRDDVHGHSLHPSNRQVHVSGASRLRSAADVGTQSWLNESARHADDGPLAAHAHSEAEREVGAEETANEEDL